MNILRLTTIVSLAFFLGYALGNPWLSPSVTYAVEGGPGPTGNSSGFSADQYDYASEISAYLNYSRGTPLFGKEPLVDIKIISGDVLSLLKSLTYSI